MDLTCNSCSKEIAYYSVRTGEAFERKTGIYCQLCAVPFIDRADSRFLMLSTQQEWWIDQVRQEHPTLLEVDLLRSLFLAECVEAATSSIPVEYQGRPAKMTDVLQVATTTAHCLLGPHAPEILRVLGITSSRAFGEILYGLVCRGVFQADQEDRFEGLSDSSFDAYVQKSA